MIFLIIYQQKHILAKGKENTGMYWVHWPGAGRGAAGWSLWGAAGAAPWGTPADPPQGMAEPLSQDDGPWGKVCVRKSKNAGEQRGVGKNSEKHPCMLPRWEKKEGRRHSRHWSGDFPSAHGEDCAGAGSPEGLQPMDNPHGSRGAARGGRSSRDQVLWTDHNPCGTQGRGGRGVGDGGGKLRLGKGGGSVFVSQHPTLFQLAIN